MAVAFNWTAPSGVPWRMGAGDGQVIVGVAWSTDSCTLAVAVVKFTASAGVKSATSEWLPAPRIVPAGWE